MSVAITASAPEANIAAIIMRGVISILNAQATKLRMNSNAIHATTKNKIRTQAHPT